ncbi:MAG TPA: prenyltransferase/squalene oxidase repeat-containing protein [Urbifossiella sp.]
MNPTRRNILQVAAAGGAAGLLAYAGHGQEAAPPPAQTGADFITPETQAAIERGLAFLSHWLSDDGYIASSAAVGITSLAGLALMAGGHQPGRGRHGRSVSKAIDFVLAAGAAGTPGFLATGTAPAAFRNSETGAMYSHGFGCLFLSEVCGMLPDKARQKKVKEMLEQAIAYTVEARNKDGGWRYVPRTDADVSVTVAQMMALRAAKNAGIFVRKNVIDDGVAYIRACQMTDGGFSYWKGSGYSGFARSAAAIVGLNSAGIYSGRDIERGLRYVQQFLPGRQFNSREMNLHYYYGQYYAALAMWTAGGEYWNQWFPAIRDDLLGRARSGAGIWNDNNGQAYATAMSLIILQLPNNYLPILQK